MNSYARAVRRYRTLLHPLSPFPQNCDVCTERMRGDQEISVCRRRGFVRATHRACAIKLGWVKEPNR